jgi:pilus assembly protein FimV
MLESFHLRDTHRMKSSCPPRRRSLLAPWLSLALCAATGGAWGLGFGGSSSQAVLGQPLNFAVKVRVEPGERAEAECVGAEVSFGDARLGRSQVRAQWDPPVAGLEQTLRVRTLAAVSEPIVTVDVTVGCKARLQRQFVALADPPSLVLSPPVPAAAPSAAPAPATAPAPRPSARRTPAPRTAAAPSVSPPSSGEAAPPPRRRAAPRAAEAPSPAVTEQPRLRLDPLDAELFSSPSLRIAGSLGSSEAGTPEQQQAAAALWKALNTTPEQAARESERMRQLEESLAALRQESAATRQALEGLQASLREAQQQRYANPLVYVLLALCLVLATALVWMARQRGAGAGAWWRPSAAGSLPVDLASAPAPHPLVSAPAASEAAAPLPCAQASMAPAIQPEPSAPPAPKAAATATAPAAASLADADAAPEKVAVEELIDLEQQAEFFLALGQDESAIDLLQGHVREHREPSPLPFLKLLEIHKRRGDREAYDDTRREFNLRFNAYAPSWDEDLAAGRSLEDYPTVISRLQGLWDSPVRSLEVLQASLLRGDGDAKAFDLPAYRELLVLYGIARDRVQLDATGEEVDLLLPLDEPEDPYATRLEPTIAVPASSAFDAPSVPDEDKVDVHLDLGLDDEPPSPPPQPPARPDARPSNLIEFIPVEPTEGDERGKDRQG